MRSFLTPARISDAMPVRVEAPGPFRLHPASATCGSVTSGFVAYATEKGLYAVPSRTRRSLRTDAYEGVFLHNLDYRKLELAIAALYRLNKSR